MIIKWYVQKSYRRITQVYQIITLFTMILKEANIENATPNIKYQLETNNKQSSPDLESP